uniref:Chromosome 12 open reading frame 56 n=1 Tax=Cavia porcellus TaxID=10141 RepID=A0A286XF85_CAVPO
MASLAQSGFPTRTNSRLDTFLRRQLPPEDYDAIRAYEPCVVVSHAEKHACKYVVLSDQLIYLADNPPKSIRRVVALRDVVAIDLVDDYPEFLSSSDREINQHIRIIYSSTGLKKKCGKSRAVRKFLFPFHRSNASNQNVKEEHDGPIFWRDKEPSSLSESSFRDNQESYRAFTDSTPSPPSDINKLCLLGQSAFRPLPAPPRRSCPPSPAAGRAVSSPSCMTNTKEPQGLPDLSEDSSTEISFKWEGNTNEFHLGNSLPDSPWQSDLNQEKNESELHLYVVSTTSSLFLHLRSSWNNYVIKATLLQDPQYATELSPVIGSQKPYTSDLFCFLVNKLHEYLPEARDKHALHNKSQRADELVACIEIIQTLGLMFRETEIESSRLNTLAAKKGTLFKLLVILISKPQIPKPCPVLDIHVVADSPSAEMSYDAELQKLILEYTDKATALLYEILLVFQQGNLGLESTTFAISWMMSFLQNCPPIITFVAGIVKQVVKGLSASFQLLSPCQAVLLYQQFYILKSCLQYSKTLAEYIRNDYSEEFRYFIHIPALKKRLPLHYPITQPTTQLFHEVLKLVEQKQYVKC